MTEKTAHTLYNKNNYLRKKVDGTIEVANLRLKTIQKLYVELHLRQQHIDALQQIVDNYQKAIKK